MKKKVCFYTSIILSSLLLSSYFIHAQTLADEKNLPEENVTIQHLISDFKDKEYLTKDYIDQYLEGPSESPIIAEDEGGYLIYLGDKELSLASDSQGAESNENPAVTSASYFTSSKATTLGEARQALYKLLEEK